MNAKAKAAISLDLDNLWSYQRADGQGDWRSFSTYLPHVIPRILTVMDSLEMPMTVFVVGKDAEIEDNKESLIEIAKAGHSIGNHSYMHEPWLHKYSTAELQHDLEQSESAIKALYGTELKGFRAPGFSDSPSLSDELAKRGYAYNASSFPTYIGPLARWAYFRSANLSDEEKAERADQFGKFTDGFGSLRPHIAHRSYGTILEIPVTTCPILKVPIHLTYIHYMAEISESLAMSYFKTALFLCRLFRITPIVLLHPLDFLAADEVPELKGFPGYGTDSALKTASTLKLLSAVKKHFQPLSLCEFADTIIAGSGIQKGRQHKPD